MPRSSGTNPPACTCLPDILPMRARSAAIDNSLADRLRTVLPAAMREGNIDMWIVLCQEDDLDPVFATMIPMDTWCPILQILVFHDRGEAGVEGINLSGTNTGDLYTRPYTGQLPESQWPLLKQLVEERDPARIGINIGQTQWAAGGLTQNLYSQLLATLPERHRERLVSAEPTSTKWLACLTETEIGLFEHVVDVAHRIISHCYSSQAIEPNVTTVDDLRWLYWQVCADHGLEAAFRPFFGMRRSPAMVARHGKGDQIIRPGDFLHCDVGIEYLRLHSDHQQWAYVRQPGEREAPAGARRLMAEANRLQDAFMGEFRAGLSGNELLAAIFDRARSAGIPQPKVYSHSLGLFLHEPGPLIGLPWEQEDTGERGEVRLENGNAFTMELSVTDPLPEWEGADLRLAIEEDVIFAGDRCRVLGNRQTEFYLI